LADLPTIFQEALAHHQSGRLTDAVRLYDSILSLAPGHADTLYLRGVAALQQDDLSTAENRLRRAIGEQPKRAPYWVSLAQTKLRQGNRSEAKDSFERAIGLDPALPAAHAALGDLFLAERSLPAARYHYDKSLALDANQKGVWINLSQVQIWEGAFELALESAARALAIDPGSTEARFNRAVALRALGQPGPAESEYREILRRAPGFVPATINWANLLRSQHRLAEAAEVYQQSATHQFFSADLRLAWGSLLHELGDWNGAIEQYRHVLAIEPNQQAAIENLAGALRRVGRWDEGLALLQQATTHRPEEQGSWIQLGHAYLEREDDVLGREAMRRASHCRPGDWVGNLRMARICPLLSESESAIAQYRHELEQTLRQLLERDRSINALDDILPGLEPSFHLPFHGLDDRPLKELYSQLFESIDWKCPLPACRRPGKPRVGIVVTDSHEPVFLRSMGGIIERLTHRADYELSLAGSPAGIQRIRRGWRAEGIEYLPLPDRFSLAADRLRQADFDLLFYWEIGTDSLNYFLPMARLARVQAVSWGVPITTGIRTVDDYLSSHLLEPDGAQQHYSEHLVLLQRLLSYQCRRMADIPPPRREEFGLREEDHVYVCAQNLGKYHPAFVRVLDEILEQDPAGRLVVTASRNAWPSQMFERILRKALGERFSRVKILPPLDAERYHGLLRIADVQLDPFPFCGANTSYDAFSFRLPVVTLEGAFQRGRFTSGCYRAMGLADWVAPSPFEYVERAIAWGTCPDRRRQARQLLTERTANLFEDGETVREWEEYMLERLATV
jgi:tetratricopeptide (TPR) repeat protein